MFQGATDLRTCCPPHPVSAHLSLGLWWEGRVRFLTAAQGLPATVFVCTIINSKLSFCSWGGRKGSAPSAQGELWNFPGNDREGRTGDPPPHYRGPCPLSCSLGPGQSRVREQVTEHPGLEAACYNPAKVRGPDETILL